MRSRSTPASATVLDELLSGLNPQQRAAAMHDDQPLLIVAGAGSGKTTTLAHRVASLIARGTDPGRILLLTFTRRSAAEMLRRVEALLARWRAIASRPPESLVATLSTDELEIEPAQAAARLKKTGHAHLLRRPQDPEEFFRSPRQAIQSLVVDFAVFEKKAVLYVHLDDLCNEKVMTAKLQGMPDLTFQIDRTHRHEWR